MYDELAHYYDLIHRDLTDDIPFILGLAERFGDPILELGCGSGRLLLPLAQAGYAVTGIDSAPAMLSTARRLASAVSHGDKIRLEDADITNFELHTRNFAFALYSHNTLMHLDSAQCAAALAATARHLRSGASLVIDNVNPLWLPDVEDQTEFEPERTFSDPATGLEVTQFSRYRNDPGNSRMMVEWKFVQMTSRTRAPTDKYATTTYHYLDPDILDQLLEGAGLVWEEEYGGYDGEPFSEESDRLIVIARRR